MTAPSATRASAEQVRLVVADVDGTLVTPDKILTPQARSAVRHVMEAGIAFTITSGRPPLGMKMLIEDLHLRDTITASTADSSYDLISPSSANVSSRARRCGR